MNFRASADGNTLDLISSVDEHNHDRNKETYSLLPRQRQLDLKSKEMVQHMLKLRVNKKLLQAELLPNKKVLLKDLHNLNSKKDSEDTLEDALKYLRNKSGNIVEIVSNEENRFLGLFYQDLEMQRTYSTYPEMMFVDAIYKVSNLRIPLYILLVEDSNGDSEIVAFMLMASEDALTMDKMVEIFKKHNPAWKNTVTIMTDKDFQERKSFKKGFNNAELLICLFHTLRTFKREITCEKMAISSGERTLYLEYAQKLTYSKNLEEYNSIYDEIKRLKLVKFINYFEKNWNPIKEQWVPALQTALSYGNRTNNRLESINSKVMQVVQRHSRLPDLYQNLDCLLMSLRAERDAKAAKVQLKIPLNINILHEEQSHYLKVLTPYAFGLLYNKFSLKNEVEVVDKISNSEFFQVQSSQGLLTTSVTKCGCRFFCCYNLPCHHILHVREKLDLPLFEYTLIPQRWTKEFYLKNSRLQLTDTSGNLSPAEIIMSSLPTKSISSQSDKFRVAMTKIQKMASLASEASIRQFPQRMQVLDDIIGLWELGKEVTVVEVETLTGSQGLHEASSMDQPIDIEQDNLEEPSSVISNDSQGLHEASSMDQPLDIGQNNLEESSIITNFHIMDHNYASSEVKFPKSSTETSHIEIQDNVFVEETNIEDSNLKKTVEIDSGSFELIFDTTVESGTSVGKQKQVPVLHNLPIMPNKLKRKGRPKGCDTTVVGLPSKKSKVKRNVSFEKKSSRDRHLLMLQWFVSRDRAFLALQGQVIEESEVEVEVNRVSCASLDSRCDIRSLRRYFTSDAWVSIESLVKFKETNLVVFCSLCTKEISCENSLTCNSCLEKFHVECSGLKTPSRSKKWYCRLCCSKV